MGSFDSFDYDIEKRLPEWWKGFGALEPINQYTQTLISQILQGLLTTMGVVQPLNCWLTIPEEYTWYHHYKTTDDLLVDENGDTLIEKPTTTLFAGNKIHVKLPNTKRRCHAKIQLKLLGTELQRNQNNNSIIFENKEDVIEELVLRNADQEIILHNIKPTSTIEILTETNDILIDGEINTSLIEGKFHKIKPTIKNEKCQVSYIDKDGNTQYKDIDIKDENKKTEITLESTKTVNFDLQVYLKKPTYTTEQNIRVATVSAFPIEWIRVFGYFCHPFNKNEGYEIIYEKQYTKKSRTTYDKISLQNDCERFYIQVKFYGIGVPLEKGFPQEENTSEIKYQPNPQLDKWGKIYNLPRRKYKTEITEDEEPFTFPKYYNYPIEQDYWYEERMVNEYSFDDASINSMFVKDNEDNSVGMLECIYPFMNDIWVYTETIDPESDTTQEITNIKLTSATQDLGTPGVEWEDPQKLVSKPLITKLNPHSNDVKKIGDYSYKTKKLKCSFDLREFDEELPQNIEIKGIELKLKTETSIQSRTIRLSEESKVIIPYPKPVVEDDTITYDNYIMEKIDIVHDEETWLKHNGYYTIGGETNLFSEKEITREQLFKGNDGKIDFELVFINENDFLQSYLYIDNMTLNIYYEVTPAEYSIDVRFDKKQIDLRSADDHKVCIAIDIANQGNIEVHDKEVRIVIPPELEFINDNFNGFTFNLEIGESFTVSDFEADTPSNQLIMIRPKTFENEGIKTGWYDILVICEDKVFSNEILVRGSET